MSIIHALMRLVLGVFGPGTGRRRKAARPIPPTPAARPRAAFCEAVPPLPVQRSPYGLDVSLGEYAAGPVRPYVMQAEWEEEDSRRCPAAVLAADFAIDLDRHVVGAEAVAR